MKTEQGENTIIIQTKYLSLILVVSLFLSAGFSTSKDIEKQTPSSQETEALVDYIKQGSQLIAAERFQEAEALFTKAISAEPNNLLYHAQLALSLIWQRKYREADLVLDHIFSKDPKFMAALWYRSVSRFSEERYEEAIHSFEETLPLIPPTNPQLAAAHRMIATSYQKRLRQDGLTYSEVDSMIDHFKTYLKLAGTSAPDRENVNQFLGWVQQQRPPQNVKRWVLTPPPIPGHSRADLVLQRDTWNMMRDGFEKAFGKDCTSPFLVNTEVIQLPDPQGEWFERWTVNRCGAFVTYKVKFTPDRPPGTGTVFFISQEDKTK